MMMMALSPTKGNNEMNILRENIIKVMNDYLGPASERFVDRNIEGHLNKKPEELSKEDIAKLANWIKISLGVISSSAEIAQEAVDRMLEAAEAKEHAKNGGVGKQTHN